MGFVWFLLGVIVGAGVMLFVYKNNKDKMTKFAEGLEREVQELKVKLAKKEEGGE